MNSCGSLENLNCAVSYLKKLLPVTSFQQMDEVGKKCEYKVFLWDYISVGEFPRNIGRLLNDAQKGYIRADAAGNVTNEIGGLFKIDADASTEVLLKILKDNEYVKLSEVQLDEMIRNIISDIDCEKSAANIGGLVGGLIGAVAGAGFAKLLAYAALGTFGSLAIGAVGLGGICYSAVSWWNSSNRNKQIETHRIEIENYADALKQLLGHVQKGNWKYADSVLAQLNFDPKDYGTSVTMTNSGIKYSKLLEKEFNKKFKDLENDLTKMVGKN